MDFTQDLIDLALVNKVLVYIHVVILEEGRCQSAVHVRLFLIFRCGREVVLIEDAYLLLWLVVEDIAVESLVGAQRDETRRVDAVESAVDLRFAT